MSSRFVFGIWLDFDIDERGDSFRLGIDVAIMMTSKKNIEIKIFSRSIYKNKILNLLKELHGGVNYVCVYCGEGKLPFSHFKNADCWFFPGAFEMDAPPPWIPSIVAVLDEHLDEFENAVADFQFDVFGGGPPTRLSFVTGANLCLSFSQKMSSVLSKNLGIPVGRLRTLNLSEEVSGDELWDIIREARAIASLDPQERAASYARPWLLKKTFFLPPQGVPEILLFLPTIYPGGIWQASRDLINDLIDINRARGSLKLTLAVPDDEGDEDFLQVIEKNILLDRFQLIPITAYEAKKNLGNARLNYDHDLYGFMKGCEKHALRADAWFSLTDRFNFPLLPARPYGVLVYDVIQKHAPETFPPQFFKRLEQGMKPTIQAAEFVMTGGETVRDDVIDFYGVDPERVKMFPIATDPIGRFKGKTSSHIPLPKPTFILQVTNMAPHKGVQTALRALAQLRQFMGPLTPTLVICGSATERLGSKQARADDLPYIKNTRILIDELDLKEGRDFVCLGFVKEEELLDLYKRATVVLNAGRYDLGTLCALEASYFGKPVISSRYPAIEEMAKRYSLPIQFFEVENESDLAVQLGKVLRQPNLSELEVQAIRSSINQPHLTHRHYAENIYQLLVDMGRKGRMLRKDI